MLGGGNLPFCCAWRQMAELFILGLHKTGRTEALNKVGGEI